MPPALLLAAALIVAGPPADNFLVQAELQGLYDESSQATLQFVSASDVDEFHAVLCTADWIFTDLAGHPRTWTEMRPDAVRALSEPRLDAMTQTIVTLSVDAGGATVVVNLSTVRTVVRLTTTVAPPASTTTSRSFASSRRAAAPTAPERHPDASVHVRG